jgi:TM2 domain-containing membrane protein YozV/cold shock CspA family protein
MRGKVLGFNTSSGEGVITGEDGKRYQFSRIDIRSGTSLMPGREVDFELTGDRASEIFPVVAGSGEKNKLVAGLLALFLGSFGIHKFYLGYKTSGFIMLGVWFGGLILLAIPSIVIGVIAFIEGIIYLTSDDQKFYDTYIAGKREWF